MRRNLRGSDVGRRSGRSAVSNPSYINDLMVDMRSVYTSRLRREANYGGGDDEVDVVRRPLRVEDVDLCSKDNAKLHHTDVFELVDCEDPLPVLRRGQPFYMSIKFHQKVDEIKDHVKLSFLFGQNPMPSKGTQIDLPIQFGHQKFTKPSGKWDVRVHSVKGDRLVLQINIPATVGIGEWRLRIVTNHGTRRVPETYDDPRRIYILFNPWCKEDAVYMESQTMRNEYVLNDVGKVYVGSHNNPRGRRWVFGQFEDVVLPACMLLLGKSRLDYTARANPVKVVRCISAVVNSQDDDGVIVGNWSGNYDDATPPYAWTGSAAILEEYLSGGGEPVKYGQCWVFSGVTTTVCRALGIPCRSVTNFVSAHDTDETITIDKYFDEDGEEIENNGDSIWNFHVWNDCWMSRPDLPSGYGGWQAIDATPQETSDGVYQAGPASLVAIRRGEIGFQYDTPFLFSEVNADVIHWKQDPKSDIGWTKLKCNKYHVGRCVLTKKCGVDDDEADADKDDILKEYKSSEGSLEERMSVLNAARCGGLSYLYDMPTASQEDVYFDLVDIDRILIGQPFHIRVKLKNRAREKRTISIVLNASSLYYTGVRANKIRREKQVFILNAGQEESLRLTIQPDEYLDKLVDHSMMKIYALATVQETKQTWAEEDDFVVDKPRPLVKIKGPVRVGRSFEVEIRFTNPLKTRLERCEFTFEGPGISKRKSVKLREVKPEETVVHFERFIPRLTGTKKLVVGFNSRQLSDIIGSKQIDVIQ
ncbi:F13A1 (predicted) [Pycnogonum litorale]